MLPWARPLPLCDTRPEHFGKRDVVHNTRHVVVVAGLSRKVLKGVPSKMKASYATRHNSAQGVVCGYLVTEFKNDPRVGIESGVLVCPPWTQADSDETHRDDDVMGMTVTREDDDGNYVLFHDLGLFIPTPVSDERKG